MAILVYDVSCAVKQDGYTDTWCAPRGIQTSPLIGNTVDAPRKNLGRECSALIERYGEVVYLNALEQCMVILGSLHAASDLVEKRSANYSDRPTSIMVQLVGYYDWLFVLMNYGPEWRQHHRAFHQVMHSEVVADYQPFQEQGARNLLRGILRSASKLGSLLRFGARDVQDRPRGSRRRARDGFCPRLSLRYREGCAPDTAFLAMAPHPEVRKKAQAQAGSVFRSDRFPEFTDMESLPYIQAVVRELLRWHIVMPIALPHRSVANDEYNGYLISGGSTILVNVWGISRDPKVCPHPEISCRSVSSPRTDSWTSREEIREISCLGSGAGSVPDGISLFIIYDSVLNTFDFRALVDAHGASVPIEHKVPTERAMS